MHELCNKRYYTIIRLNFCNFWKIIDFIGATNRARMITNNSKLCRGDTENAKESLGTNPFDWSRGDRRQLCPSCASGVFIFLRPLCLCGYK
jgi:hypothetical protein